MKNGCTDKSYEALKIIAWVICLCTIAIGFLSMMISTEETRGKDAPTFNDLLDAIEWVESRGDSEAVGDNGCAVGSMQLWKIYVDDVNRIVGYPKFCYGERFDRDRSREMVTIYLNHYGGTFEEMARKHNGGPQGHKKEATKKYWEKVKDYLNKKGN